MKFQIIKVFIIASLFIASTASARPVDPINISQENIALMKEIEQHCSKQTFAESQACSKKLTDRYAREGKFRGTTPYAETHYKKLAEKALYAKLAELKQLRKKARDLSDAMMDLVAGELTDEKYDAEIQWIHGELKLRGLSVPRG